MNPFVGVVIGLAMTIGVFFCYFFITVFSAALGCLGIIGFQVLTVVLCLVALLVGIRAAVRGNRTLPYLLIVPAIIMLFPATSCAVATIGSSLQSCRV